MEHGNRCFQSAEMGCIPSNVSFGIPSRVVSVWGNSLLQGFRDLFDCFSEKRSADCETQSDSNTTKRLSCNHSHFTVSLSVSLSQIPELAGPVFQGFLKAFKGSKTFKLSGVPSWVHNRVCPESLVLKARACDVGWMMFWNAHFYASPITTNK